MQPSIERGLAHRFPRGNFQFHSAEWSKQLMYRCTKIPVRSSVLVKGRPQDVPGLLFHGAPVLGMRSRRFSPSSRLRTVMLAKVPPPCFCMQNYTTIAMQSSLETDLYHKTTSGTMACKALRGAQFSATMAVEQLSPKAICECDPAFRNEDPNLGSPTDSCSTPSQTPFVDSAELALILKRGLRTPRSTVP